MAILLMMLVGCKTITAKGPPFQLREAPPTDGVVHVYCTRMLHGALAPNKVGRVSVDNDSEAVQIELGGFVTWQGPPGRHVFTARLPGNWGKYDYHVPVDVEAGGVHFVRIGWKNASQYTFEEVNEEVALPELSRCKGNYAEFEKLEARAAAEVSGP